MRQQRNTGGYVTLLSVLVVGAVGLAVTASLLLLGIGSARTSFAVRQSLQAKSLASACAEQGLEQIRANISYVGTGNLSLGQGVCSYTVTNQGGSNRTIDSVGTVGTVVRKSRVIINAIIPLIIVSSWQEVEN
jgi:hypothetical protein